MTKFLSLKDHVYEFIAEQISNGALIPEEKINENEICDQLNISRTPVREALIQLSCEGILVNLPRKGFVVKSMDPSEARNLYQVIGTLDGLAAKLACPHLSEKQLRDMSFYIDSMNLAIDGENYEMYYKQQEIFHGIYLDECRNEVLVTSLLRLKNKFVIKAYDLSDNSKAKDILKATNDEHNVILALFRKKASQELMTYMEETHWNPDLAETETTL
ncbi:MAG: GntR family transcriptional regulator [Anaerovoracaceae bacterium]